MLVLEDGVIVGDGVTYKSSIKSSYVGFLLFLRASSKVHGLKLTSASILLTSLKVGFLGVALKGGVQGFIFSIFVIFF